MVSTYARAQEASDTKPKVLASFSILADLVTQVGGDKISVATLVDWDEDAHVFHASPTDIKKVRNADLLVINGLGFEGWLSRLVSAAGFSGKYLEASAGIDLIHVAAEDHEDHHGHHHHGNHDGHDDHGQKVDPHAWHSIKAIKIYVANISRALTDMSPQHGEYFESRKNSYLKALDELHLLVEAELAAIPDSKRSMLLPHNSFAYMAKDYSLTIYSLQGVSTEAEASAADVAKVVRFIRDEKIGALFTENVANARLIKQVQNETNAHVGGELISGALSKDLAPTYLDMMRYNLNTIVNALVSR